MTGVTPNRVQLRNGDTADLTHVNLVSTKCRIAFDKHDIREVYASQLKPLGGVYLFQITKISAHFDDGTVEAHWRATLNHPDDVAAYEAEGHAVEKRHAFALGGQRMELVGWAPSRVPFDDLDAKTKERAPKKRRCCRL